MIISKKPKVFRILTIIIIMITLPIVLILYYYFGDYPLNNIYTIILCCITILIDWSAGGIFIFLTYSTEKKDREGKLSVGNHVIDLSKRYPGKSVTEIMMIVEGKIIL